MSAGQINSAKESLGLQKQQKEVDLKSSELNFQTAATEKEQAARTFQTVRTQLENDVKKTYENTIITVAQANIKIDESLVNIDKLLGIDLSSEIAPFIGNRSSIDKVNAKNLYTTTSKNLKIMLLNTKI